VFQIQFYTVHCWHRLKVIRKSNKLRCPCRLILNWPGFCDFWRKPRNTILLGYTYSRLKHQLHFNAIFVKRRRKRSVAPKPNSSAESTRRPWTLVTTPGSNNDASWTWTTCRFSKVPILWATESATCPTGRRDNKRKVGFGYFVSFYTPLSTKFNLLYIIITNRMHFSRPVFYADFKSVLKFFPACQVIEIWICRCKFLQ